jgi:hypothetical protein
MNLFILIYWNTFKYLLETPGNLLEFFFLDLLDTLLDYPDVFSFLCSNETMHS